MYSFLEAFLVLMKLLSLSQFYAIKVFNLGLFTTPGNTNSLQTCFFLHKAYVLVNSLA